MKVIENFDLVDKQLLDTGYATLSVYDIDFDRYYTEEEMEVNGQQARSMTPKQWSEHCMEESRLLETRMQPVLDLMDKKYDIHQTTEENSTMAHYESDWDLFFWSNQASDHPYLDYFRLTFNARRNPERNLALLSEIRPVVESLEAKNVCCKIRYNTVITAEQLKRLETDARDILDELERSKKFIRMWGNGRVRKVEEDGKEWYGFFRKGAKNHYHRISPKEAVLWKLKQDSEKEAV